MNEEQTLTSLEEKPGQRGEEAQGGALITKQDY